MANEDNLAVRVSILEVQMATVAADIAEIRANYVTKEYLNERLDALEGKLIARMDSRLDMLDSRLDAILEKLGSRLDAVLETMDGRLDAVLEKIDSRLDAINVRLAGFVTREEFGEEMIKQEQRLHTWVNSLFIKMFITLFFSLAGMQFAMFQLYLHAK